MSLMDLSPDSRLWIYTADRILSITEEAELTSELILFVNDWKAHGTALSAGYSIVDYAIVLIAIDDTVAMPSGCSIDKAFQLLQKFGIQHQIDFFQRTLTAKKTDNGVEILNMIAAKEAFLKGTLKESDWVYNTLITHLNRLDTQFLISFSDHWLGQKLLQKQNIL
jgi:hypothetical protein